MRSFTLRGAVTTLAVVGVGLTSQAIHAQDTTERSTDSDGAQSEIVGQLPAGHFLENIARAPDGSFWITDYVGRAIYRYAVDTGFRHHMELDVHPADIEFGPDGTAFVTAQTNSVLKPFDEPSNLILRISPDGTLNALQGAGVFFNGIVGIGEGRFVVTDSGTETLWTFDTDFQQIYALVRDPLLGKSDPQSMMPGANGVQRHARHLYVSNTERALLMRFALPLTQDSRPHIVLSDTVIDDFAFMPDGTIMAASHGDTLLRIDLQSGTRTVVADASDGVRGSTSVILSEPDRSVLVITDGGLFGGGTIGTANLVRVTAE